VKYTFPVTYGTDSTLIEIDEALIPLVAGALKHFELRGYWKTDADYEQGYNAFAELQAEFMGRGIERLQMEIRALRGVDELDANYNDPLADPFTLHMGSIEDVKTQLDTTIGKLEAIRLLIEGINGSTSVEDILTKVGQIAILLG
jgi:hypothetical protein